MTRLAPTLRFRRNPAVAVAAVIMISAGWTLGSWAPYLLVLLIIPVLVAVWGWRCGTFVDAEGITVRAAVASRRVPWSDVTALVTDEDGSVSARLGSGSLLTLTAVHPRDLHAIVAASGQALVDERT